MNLPAIVRRVSQPFVQELKRQLCFRGAPQVFRVREFGDYRFRCGSKTEYHRCVTFGGELGVLGALLLLVRPDDVVWDIGASIGLFTVHVAGLGAQVVAIEPDPATFSRLEENVALNGLEAHVTSLRLALSDSPGTVQLHSDGLVGNAPSLRDLRRHAAAVTVIVDTVDCLVAKGIKRPTVLKIDVEGAEGAVLAGARQTLIAGSGPRLLLVEMHPEFLPSFGWSVERVEDELRGAGYLTIAGRPRGRESHILAVRANREW